MKSQKTKITLPFQVPARILLIAKLVWLLIQNIYGLFFDLFNSLATFLGPVSNSIYGEINAKELFRVLTLASTSGTTLWGSLQFIEQNVDNFVTDKTVANFIHAFVAGLQYNYFALAVTVMVFFIDWVRRKYHGDDPQS